MVVQGQIPPNANGRAENIVLMDDLLSSPGLTNRSAAIAVPRQLGYRLRLIDHNGCQQLPIAAPAPALLQLFIRGNPFRGSAEITDMAQTWLRALIKNEGLIGIVVYGSPYAFASFEADLPEGIARGFTYGQTPLAQELLMQALCDYEVGLNSSSTFTD
jgi:beta-glucosidase